MSAAGSAAQIQDCKNFNVEEVYTVIQHVLAHGNQVVLLHGAPSNKPQTSLAVCTERFRGCVQEEVLHAAGGRNALAEIGKLAARGKQDDGVSLCMVYRIIVEASRSARVQCSGTWLSHLENPDRLFTATSTCWNGNRTLLT